MNHVRIRRREVCPGAGTLTSEEIAMSAELKLGENVRGFREDRKQFRLICFAAFAICLAPAVIDAFLPRKWRLLPQDPEANRSIFGQAKAAAHSAATFGLMGY
jgi:hypothetical protein